MMDIISFGTIAGAVASAMLGTSGIKRVENYMQLGETIADTPCLQVYPTTGNTDSGGGETDRTTFNANVRQSELTLIMDGFARVRSNLREDIKAQIALADAVDARLIAITSAPPFFGLVAVRAVRWSWEAIEFKYGGGDTAPVYSGVRFTVTITIF